MLSLAWQVYAWSPWRLRPSHLLCLSLSRQQQPPGPQDILDPSLHHTSSTPPLLLPNSFFFSSSFYTATSSRWTGSALATPPLTPSPEVPGMHDKARAQTHTFLYLLDCVRHPQCLAVRSAHARTATERVQTEIYAASLQGQISGSVSKALPVVLSYNSNYNYSVYHSY